MLPNVEKIYVSKFLMRTSTWQGSTLLARVHTGYMLSAVSGARAIGGWWCPSCGPILPAIVREWVPVHSLKDEVRLWLGSSE